MTAIIFHDPVFSTQVEAGDKLYFYQVGTTSDLTVYTDFALSSESTQPVIANSEGRFIPLYISSTGGDPKVVLTGADDVEKWTCERYPIDDLSALSATVSNNSSSIAALDGDIATAEAEIEVLQTESSDYESRVTILESAEDAADYSLLVPIAMGSVTGGASPIYGQSVGVTSTVSRVAAGQYDITFTTARATNKYILSITAGGVTTNSPLEVTSKSKTTAGFRVETWYTTGGSTRAKIDRDFDFVVWDRDQ